jgi:flagellar hook-length control protein FliK
LVSATAVASNREFASASQSSFASILQSLGLDDSEPSSPATTTQVAVPQPGVSTPGVSTSGGASTTRIAIKQAGGNFALRARTQKLLAAKKKSLKGMKVMTPAQAAQLASTATQAQTAQSAALSAAMAGSQVSASSSGGLLSQIASSITDPFTATIDALSGSSQGSSSSSPGAAAFLSAMQNGAVAANPRQAAQTAQAAQPQATQSAALSAAMAGSQASSSSSGGLLSQIVSDIADPVAAAIDAVSGSSSAPSGAARYLSAMQNGAVAVNPQQTAQTAQSQASAATVAAANSDALQPPAQPAQTAAAQSAAAALALQGARITASANPTADQIAASKQQAFANLKPATPVQNTVTLALPPDIGSTAAKADTKDGNSQSGGDSKAGNGSSSSSQAASASAPSSAQPAAQPAAQQGVQLANSASSNAPAADTSGAAGLGASAAGAASLNTGATSLNAPTTASLSVGPQQPQGAVAPNINMLAVSIAAKSIEGAKQFDIRLDPPELGRVDVKLSVDNTGKAQAHLTVEKPQTLNLLQRDSGSLQRSLKEAGVNLANSGLQFSLKGEQQFSGSATPTRSGRALSVSAVAGIDSTTATASTHSFAHDRARLDIRV